MKKFLGLSILLMGLVGCSGIEMPSVNPMNWFDREARQPTPTETQEVIVVDNRELLPQVTEVSRLPISNGMILLAKGLPPTQGFWSPVLVPTNNELPLDGYLNYELRATGPTDQVVEGSEDSRELQAARTITADKLNGVIGIRVIALANNMTITVEG